MPTQRFIRLPVPTAQFGQEIRYRELRWLYASTRDALSEREPIEDQPSQTEAIRRRLPLPLISMTQAQAARLFPVTAGALIP